MMKLNMSNYKLKFHIAIAINNKYDIGLCTINELIMILHIVTKNNSSYIMLFCS